MISGWTMLKASTTALNGPATPALLTTDAVVGGFYLDDNGSGEREIRFPVYAAPEAAAVNFVHCLLLAYLGSKDYGFDAFSEGLVRASTMRIARTAGALPASLDN